MPRPCSVCAHPKRAEIDIEAAQHRVNVAGLARKWGVSRDSLTAHRNAHLPDFLPVLVAEMQRPAFGSLMAEAQRLYVSALSGLAAAEAGVITHRQHTDGTDVEVRQVSSDAVARMLRESRACLDQLAKLAVDQLKREDVGQGEQTRVDTRLDKAIGEALTRAKALGATTYPSIDEAEVVTLSEEESEESELIEEEAGVGVGGTPGPGAGKTPAPVPVGGSPENRDIPNPTDPHIQQDGRQSNPPMKALPSTELRYPEWTGNPAASPEERKAAGFAPIPVFYPSPATTDDATKVGEEELQRVLHARQQAALRAAIEAAQAGTSASLPHPSDPTEPTGRTAKRVSKTPRPVTEPSKRDKHSRGGARKKPS